jgi:hypothetical protein
MIEIGLVSNKVKPMSKTIAYLYTRAQSKQGQITCRDVRYKKAELQTLNFENKYDS